MSEGDGPEFIDFFDVGKCLLPTKNIKRLRVISV